MTVRRTAPTECPVCHAPDPKQDEDVLDTWFSSALWPFSVFGWPEKTLDFETWYPTSVLVTGFDIIFFWVARMMFAGLHFTGSVPFKDVYIHALVRDEHGEKMSKMKGNVVDPLVVIDKWGADAFRFTLMAFAAQGRDVLWNEKRVEGYHRFTTKIWQALRFCFLTGDGYDPNGEMAAPGPYDRWILARTGAAVARVRAALDEYRFNDAASEIYAFTWAETCDWFIELSKGTLYSETATFAEKNRTQHTLFSTIGAIVRLVHPIMPFLSEEIWHLLPNTSGFVAVAPYPKATDYPADPAVLDEVATLQELITEVRRIRAEMELAPKLTLTALIGDDALLARLAPHARALGDIANVTPVRLVDRPKGYATAVVRGVEIVLPLEGIVDFGEEVKRLDKALAKIDKDALDLGKRLGNEAFTSRAPKEIVEELKLKLETARIRGDMLRANRDRLAAAVS